MALDDEDTVLDALPHLQGYTPGLRMQVHDIVRLWVFPMHLGPSLTFRASCMPKA